MTDELTLGRKILTFIFFFTLLADFVVGLTGTAINVPSIQLLNSTSITIQNKTSYIINSISNPLGFPFDISRINTQSNGVNGIIPNWILNIGPVIIDAGYNLLSVLINLLLLFASGLYMVFVICFLLVPSILGYLNFGFISPFIVIANVFIFSYMGLISFRIFSDILASLSHPRMHR